MILTRKRRLRLFISQQTAFVPRSEKLRQSQEAFSHLEHSDVFRKAANVALFWSMSDEIPTQSFIEKWAGRKNIYLPIIESGEMLFARYIPGCKMVQGGLRILVPEGTPFIDPAQLDLLIVPGVAFDPYGGRLGRGQGFYDRFLEKNPVRKIGICLEHQFVGNIPLEPHDQRMDAVVTSSGAFIPVKEPKQGEQEAPHEHLNGRGTVYDSMA